MLEHKFYLSIIFPEVYLSISLPKRQNYALRHIFIHQIFMYVVGGDGGSRTHVQKYRHLSFYECSRYIRVSHTLMPIDRRRSS